MLNLDNDENDVLDVKISDEFISNGIEVKMMKFDEKDASETGFSKLLYLINRTTETRFSDLMRIRLNENKETYGNLMMTSGKSILVMIKCVKNWLIGLIYGTFYYIL